ncbi:MAG: cyclodeaminase/cyclohydrolase family protein [Clostridiales bacterium]|nr:cyclodeaminase/cyclohydrolase family protein [Clostridiales bacterium]
MFEKLTIEEYNKILASKAPTPGGGSALAQVGAVACSLVEMGVNVTLSKPTDSDTAEYLNRQLDVIARAKKAFYKLSSDDAAAFQRIIDVLRLPKTTEEESSHRSRELQKAYHRAAIVPLDVMNICREIVKLCKVRIMPHLGKYVKTDCVIAVDLCKTVARNCLLNVHANTQLLTDPTLKTTLEKQGAEILQDIERI